jgi:hypothetical protein
MRRAEARAAREAQAPAFNAILTEVAESEQELQDTRTVKSEKVGRKRYPVKGGDSNRCLIVGGMKLFL